MSATGHRTKANRRLWIDGEVTLRPTSATLTISSKTRMGHYGPASEAGMNGGESVRPKGSNDEKHDTKLLIFVESVHKLTLSVI